MIQLILLHFNRRKTGRENRIETRTRSRQTRNDV